MSVDDLRHGLFRPQKCSVGDYVHPTGKAEVATYGERLPTVAHNIITEGALHNLVLVVNCEAVLAEDASKLTHDVWLVLPVVLDEHSRYVGSAGNVVGGEWREGITRSHVHLAGTTHGIYLDLEEKETYILNNNE